MKIGITVFVCWVSAIAWAASPINWQQPASFNNQVTGLGLTQLSGITHTVIYDPQLSGANTDLGGNGIYESLEYGMFNHDPRIVVFHNKFIVKWNNHATDENGPGGRVLAKVGTFSSDMENIAWGGSETLVEITPPPVLVKSRLWTHDADIIDEHCGQGNLSIINNRLYSNGSLRAIHGWSNDPQYRSIPVPTENWSDGKTDTNIYDVAIDLKLRYYQAWKMCGNMIVPIEPMYCSSNQITSAEVTPGRFKTVIPAIDPYPSMAAFSTAPASFQNDIYNGTVTEFLRYPKYATGTMSIAADGLNGLSHYSEFKRPDGKWVVLRDNLLNRGYYYAALKNNLTDDYPPAWQTNLYGDAWPAAGELPDGRCYIIGNSMDRQEMFITVSSDGINFNKTWLLLYTARTTHPGIGKTVAPAGPQYFKAIVIKNNLWIVYSIAKEQIGITKVPISLLN